MAYTRANIARSKVCRCFTRVGREVIWICHTVNIVFIVLKSVQPGLTSQKWTKTQHYIPHRFCNVSIFGDWWHCAMFPVLHHTKKIGDGDRNQHFSQRHFGENQLVNHRNTEDWARAQIQTFILINTAPWWHFCQHWALYGAVRMTDVHAHFGHIQNASETFLIGDIAFLIHKKLPLYWQEGHIKFQ